MSIQSLVESINKKFNGEALMLFGDSPQIPRNIISTGIVGLDKALGVGGIPEGRLIEIYGSESAGKTTLSLTIMAQFQKVGKQVAFVDAEHALDTDYASAIGVDMPKILFSQPDSGEQALEIVEAIVRSGEVSLIVVDSVAALTPRSELDGEMGDANVGKQARLMSQAMRKLVAICATNKCTIIFINQLRDKIGVTWGSPETTTGGKALKFYATMRMDIRRIAAVKSGELNIGNKTKVKVVKNKLSAPYKEAEFDIIFGEGVSTEGDLLDLALAAGLIVKKGAWFAYNGNNLAQGREGVRKALKDPTLSNMIKEELQVTKNEESKG